MCAATEKIESTPQILSPLNNYQNVDSPQKAEITPKIQETQKPFANKNSVQELERLAKDPMLKIAELSLKEMQPDIRVHVHKGFEGGKKPPNFNIPH